MTTTPEQLERALNRAAELGNRAGEAEDRAIIRQLRAKCGEVAG